MHRILIMTFKHIQRIQKLPYVCACSLWHSSFVVVNRQSHRVRSFGHYDTHIFYIFASHVYTRYVNALHAYGTCEEMQHHEALQTNAACHFVCMCQSTCTLEYTLHVTKNNTWKSTISASKCLSNFMDSWLSS